MVYYMRVRYTLLHHIVSANLTLQPYIGVKYSLLHHIPLVRFAEQYSLLHKREKVEILINQPFGTL